jgi:flagella basal body P-ring formation protein FlgA
MTNIIVKIAVLLVFLTQTSQADVDKKKHEVFEELRAALRADIPEKIRFEIHNINLGEIPPNSHIGRITPHPPFGTIQFELSWDEGGRERRAFGSATVRAYSKVAVAKISIKHGDLIDPTNVAFEERELSPYVNSGYIMDPETLRNLRSNGYIHPGELLNASNTQSPFAVAVGEMLDVIHNQGNVEVKARVRALSNGRIGDWIRVENPSSQKILTAKVTGIGEVQTR